MIFGSFFFETSRPTVMDFAEHLMVFSIGVLLGFVVFKAGMWALNRMDRV